MRALRILRSAALLSFAGAVVTVCAMYWPANLGGRTTFVTTHGSSMAPRFHAGDLAVVQPSSHYHVGEIVAYHSVTLGNAVVLHRIIAVDGGHFSFKGDNNPFVDPDHPTLDRLVGRLRVRVPRGGAIRALLDRPLVLIPFLFVTLGGLFWLPFNQKSKRRRARRSGRVSHSPRLGRVGVATLTAAALATTGAVFAAVTVWRMPRSEAATASQSYSQTATLSYSGAAPRGAAYPDGRIRAGDPVFTRMVHRIAIDGAFVLAPKAAAAPRADVHGTSRVIAELSSTTGWHRELILASEPFAGAAWRSRATLDLRALRRLQRAFTTETGLSATQASLRVTWKLHVEGSLSGSATHRSSIRADLAPRLDFQLTPVELLPTAGASAAGAKTPATVVTDAAIAIPSTRDRGVTILGLRLPGDLLRALSLLLVAAVLAGGAFVIALDRRRSSRGQITGIVARYRYLLVRADAIPRTAGRSVVRVDSLRDLIRLAKLHEELIVYAEAAGARRFALFTDGVAYLYELEPAGEATRIIRTAAA